MALDTICVGQTVDGTSWAEIVTPFVATIVEISEYPSENAEGSNGDNNPNVSYYPFIAYMDCKYITFGRWYRCYEYYACISNRENKRDWIKESNRC